MANQYTTISKAGIELLCDLIRDLNSVSEGIDDINLRSDGTFSSVHITDLINNALEKANERAEELCNALTKLTCEKTLTKPTLENSKINIIYLYSVDGNAPFEQYLKISDTELIDMGSTTISLNDYLTAAQIANEYAKKIDLEALTTSFNELKTKVNDHIEDTDYHVSIDDRAKWNKVEDKIDKTSIATTIDSNSTDTQIPSAKAVYDKVKETKSLSTKKKILFNTDSLVIDQEYTIETPILNYDVYYAEIFWKQSPLVVTSWYDETWGRIIFKCSVYMEGTGYFNYIAQMLYKHADSRTIKFSYCKEFIIKDNGTISTRNITEGINIFALY